jgi:malate dehydrogenase (oxaloacetate-decarboxylating)
VIGAVDIIEAGSATTLRDITTDVGDPTQWEHIAAAVRELPGAELVDVFDRTLQMHPGGKIGQYNNVPVKMRDDLSMA